MGLLLFLNLLNLPLHIEVADVDESTPNNGKHVDFKANHEQLQED